MVQGLLRALVALGEDLVSIPRMHRGGSYPSVILILTPLILSTHVVFRYTFKQNIHTHKIIIQNQK